ncbi:MAG: hypothetical protein II719_00805 [Clostridia bacterium]|nr:hypothetical protein [Clostridia bacterium]
METRWHVLPDRQGIEWTLRSGDYHTDDLEMSGFGVSYTVTYGQSEQGLVLNHMVTFPNLRIRPNNTRGSYQVKIPEEKVPRLMRNGEPVREMLRSVRIDGSLRLFCETEDGKLAVEHVCFPSAEKKTAFETVRVTNCGSNAVRLVPSCGSGEIDTVFAPMGINVTDLLTDFAETELEPGEVFTYRVQIVGHLGNEEPILLDDEAEYLDRKQRCDTLTAPMQLDTGNEILDTMFRFAKLRSGESVFALRCGKLHSPGGYSYFGASWCNDQCEYSGPYFAYTGDRDLLDAAMNAYRQYMPFMGRQYLPIPSSVIAEGFDYWNGAGDRGDAAMYLYGSTRFALASGRPEFARELLPAIEWCAEYCRRKTTSDGVVASDADELEGRFPHGDANLCTSTLAYAGLRAAACLERELGRPEKAEAFSKQADALEKSIESFFGRTVRGFETYRYYEGCDVLRSWICMPLCAGIYGRARGTIDALVSDYLMRKDGFLTSEGNETIWDRSTLYSLRGIFASGFTDEAMRLLDHYCRNRLLGERVPYAVEAYPEGGRRHLSGESTLFCKVILEGILDLVPTGFRSFTMKPVLPTDLDHLYLTDIRAFGTSFNVYLLREGFHVADVSGNPLAHGEYGQTVTVRT